MASFITVPRAQQAIAAATKPTRIVVNWRPNRSSNTSMIRGSANSIARNLTPHRSQGHPRPHDAHSRHLATLRVGGIDFDAVIPSTLRTSALVAVAAEYRRRG